MIFGDRFTLERQLCVGNLCSPRCHPLGLISSGEVALGWFGRAQVPTISECILFEQPWEARVWPRLKELPHCNPFCVDRKFAGRRQLASDPKTYLLHSCAYFFGGSYIRDTAIC